MGVSQNVVRDLLSAIKLAVPVPAIDADRAAERSKALAEIRAAEEISLSHPAVIDAKRGIVRLPIETAMALAAQMWQNPSAARAGIEQPRQAKASRRIAQGSRKTECV
jgi:hypothetical protein